nr:RNA polymerase II C-terminal domain phosphatase-like 4 [Tanacetum cinerariifolium]
MEIEFLATSHYVWQIDLWCSYMRPIVSLLSYPEASVKKDICTHPGGFGGMCVKCREKRDNQSGVPFKKQSFSHDVWLSDDEAARIRERDLKNLLRHKKLFLVLDLDHTLLNSTHFIDGDTTQEEGRRHNSRRRLSNEPK